MMKAKTEMFRFLLTRVLEPVPLPKFGVRLREMSSDAFRILNRSITGCLCPRLGVVLDLLFYSIIMLT